MTVPSPQLTEQQHAALTTRGVSIALSAGAGCGKTFVLTRRFLDTLELHNASARVSGIVAITTLASGNSWPRRSSVANAASGFAFESTVRGARTDRVVSGEPSRYTFRRRTDSTTCESLALSSSSRMSSSAVRAPRMLMT